MSEKAMIDISGAEIVQIRVSHDGRTVWINREKACILRICRIKQLIVDDMRQKGTGME